MNGFPEKDLQERLSQWAQSHATRPEQLAPLEQRIRADWAALSKATPSVVTGISSSRSRRRLLGWAVASAATAAALWLVLGVSRQPAPSVAGISWEEQVRQQSELLTRCQELFGDQLAWLVESGECSDLKLTPNDAATQAYVAVGLRLTARDKGSTQWRVVQTLNVIAAGETSVEFTAAKGDRTHLSLWAYPLDDRVIAIDLRYQPELVPDALIEASIAQVGGATQTISEFSRDGVEYRLLQTAQQIDAGVPKDRTS